MSDALLSVLLIDDHTLFRKGLAELLEQRGAIRVAGMTGNHDEAMRLLQEEKPDVVIVDLNMPPLGGLTLLRRIRAEGWHCPVLILTVSDAEEDLANAMRSGAQGYLLKDMEPDDVVDAVQRAVRGETVVAPAMTLKLVHLLQGGSPADAKESALQQLT
ncbi:MAG: response regulator, partial [Pseudomonadota bacterium]